MWLLPWKCSLTFPISVNAGEGQALLFDDNFRQKKNQLIFTGQNLFCRVFYHFQRGMICQSPPLVFPFLGTDKHCCDALNLCTRKQQAWIAKKKHAFFCKHLWFWRVYQTFWECMMLFELTVVHLDILTFSHVLENKKTLKPSGDYLGPFRVLQNVQRTRLHIFYLVKETEVKENELQSTAVWFKPEFRVLHDSIFFFSEWELAVNES